ncbi:MAG: (deoxy)nucleoside triphosphate pyrophosphohydrolase [Legionellaceae bacterium]|jgi:8-oxo-dGTP diphosphatase|nr:(deoxy)nucleoside triphosphate pyrophosphohydrolase [Legionellaceae bacterium]
MMHVALAFITDASGRILITRRSLNVDHGGMWEVPGGKLEADETASAALKREVLEEVGIVVEKYRFLGQVTHSYPEKTVCLHVFKIDEHTGDADCHESQLDLRWVTRKEFDTFDFPEAMPKVMCLVESNSCSLGA